VRPAIKASIPGGPSSRILAGHSFGGLFGLYTLFHRPETFDGSILISPSVWWDDGIVLRYERAWSRRTPPCLLGFFRRRGGRAGRWRGLPERELSDEAIQALRQVDNVRELGATLARRSYQGLRLETAILPEEYHLTVFPAAFGQGLRWMVDQVSA
jgi:predicted alpha/beta superfamily hydrolase